MGAALPETSYDETPYPYDIRPATHIARLGTIARLLGRDVAPVGRCKVLEIGGGDGINLISMALAAPYSTFVSVDLSTHAVAQGRAFLAELGLTNVQVEAMDFRDLPDDAGPFDYIIAHGVYAWVSAEVREAMMAHVARLLSPRGVAMISYNAMPGCRPRQAIRDLLLDATSDIADPVERLAAAREALKFYVELWPKKAFAVSLKDEAQNLLNRPDGLLRHDELSDAYEPQLFSNVIARAKAHKLAYLSDTQLALLAGALWQDDDLQEQCLPRTKGDFLRFEQIRDFIETRSFRQSLFCLEGAPSDRAFQAARTQGLYVDGHLEPIEPSNDGEFAFKTLRGGEITTHDPRFAEGLVQLTQVYPRALPIDDVVDDPLLVQALTRLFVMGAVEFTTTPFPVGGVPGERPCAARLARLQAERGVTGVTSLRHTPVTIEDAVARRFLCRLDGTRTMPDLVRDLTATTGASASETEALAASHLRDFTRWGLIEP